jgi:hypothetical protein
LISALFVQIRAFSGTTIYDRDFSNRRWYFELPAIRNKMMVLATNRFVRFYNK